MKKSSRGKAYQYVIAHISKGEDDFQGLVIAIRLRYVDLRNSLERSVSTPGLNSGASSNYAHNSQT